MPNDDTVNAMTGNRSQTEETPADEPYRYNIRIGYDGTWYHEKQPINRPKLVQLFSGVLRRDEEGRHWLKTPAEQGVIEVDDAAFVAVELAEEIGADGKSVLSFRTNVEKWFPLDRNHPILWHNSPVTGHRTPYLQLPKGLEARLARPVYYELAQRAVPRKLNGRDHYGIESAGSFFILGDGNLPVQGG